MTKGLVCKGIGGFYYVFSDGIMYECKARGNLRNLNVSPLVGDRVEISILDQALALGIIENIQPRKNELLRPTVANVDQAIIVFSIKDPMPNMVLLDKMLILAEAANMEIVLCFNKGDLDVKFDFSEYVKRFENTGYTLLKTCATTGEGVGELSETLKEKISVFSGPSGVGKSSLLNAIEEGLALKTGELSEKIKRGKHTTRHSELMFLKTGGFVLDTPGFTSLSLEAIAPEDLKAYFPEFKEAEMRCRFDNCSHINEPDCGVKGDVRIHPSRYEAYVYILNEVTQLRRKNKKW